MTPMRPAPGNRGPGNRGPGGFRPTGVKPHLTRGPAAAVVLVTALVGLAVASCGARNTTQPGAPSTTTSVGGLTPDEAASLLQPVLEERFADSFAGLELREDGSAVVVHRRPNPRLDAEVTRLAPHVQVIFRDAEHTLAEMEAVVRRIADDDAHWRGLGVDIVAVGPAVDGSGVDVSTTTDTADARERLEARYPDMSFTVTAGPALVPPTQPGPVPPVDRRTGPPPKSLDPPPTR